MIERFDYEEIDNLVPLGMANWIETRLINHGQWVFNGLTSDVDNNFDPNDKNINETYQFTNTFVTPDEGILHQLFGEIAQPILWFLEKETGIVTEHVVRIKSNLLTKGTGDENSYHKPHIDYGGDQCLSMVYYVNDADGDTRIFDKYAIEDGHDNLTMVHSNTPKKGSALMFQSNRLHASSNPIKNDKRCIINFVFKPTDESYKKYLNIKNSS